MSDDQQLNAFLVFARALTTSDPFGARAALRFLKEAAEVSGPDVKHHLATAIEATSAALDSEEARGTAIARYALTGVTIEIEGRLDRAVP